MVYEAIRELVRYGLEKGLSQKMMPFMPEIRSWKY